MPAIPCLLLVPACPLQDYAFDYIKKNGGVDTEEDMPYWGMGLPCQGKKAADRTVVTIDGYSDVPRNDPDALRKAISQQPVSVAICASSALQVGPWARKHPWPPCFCQPRQLGKLEP